MRDRKVGSAPIPIYVAAGGPRGVAIAARHGDGVVYSLGCNEALIGLLRRQMEAAAREAGREVGEVKLIALVWFRLRRPGETLAEALRGGLGSALLSTCLNRRHFIAQHWQELDPGLVEDVLTLAAAYLRAQKQGETAHLDVWRSYMRAADASLYPLLTSRIVDTFAVYGSEEECLEKLVRMARAGVDSFLVFLSDRARLVEDMALFARTVIQRWPPSVGA